MKKLIITVLLVALLAMSSAYAIWTDSVSTSITATSAVARMVYIGRTATSSKIGYTSQNMNPPSSSNPYLNIEETVTNLNNGNSIQVTYTLQNTGNVDITFEGISFSNKSYTSDSWWVSPSDVVATVRIQYSVTNNGSTYTALVSDFESTSQVTFSDYQNNILAPSEQCTMTVTYYRVSDWFLVNIFSVEIAQTDQPMYSVNR